MKNYRILEGDYGDIYSDDGRSMAITHKGYRPENQDVAILGEDMIAVADGFGGLGIGKEASSAAINYLAMHHEHKIPFNLLCEGAQQHMPKTTGGTTLSLLRRRNENGRVFVDGGVIGDAKAYIVDLRAKLDDALVATTLDQSTVQVFINTGRFGPLDRYTYERRNIIQNSISASHHVDLPSLIKAEGEVGQLMAIAVSDGISDFVTPEEVTMLTLEHGDACGREIFRLARSRQHRKDVKIFLNGKEEVIPDTNGDNTTIATMVC